MASRTSSAFMSAGYLPVGRCSYHHVTPRVLRRERCACCPSPRRRTFQRGLDRVRRAAGADDVGTQRLRRPVPRRAAGQGGRRTARTRRVEGHVDGVEVNLGINKADVADSPFLYVGTALRRRLGARAGDVVACRLRPGRPPSRPRARRRTGSPGVRRPAGCLRQPTSRRAPPAPATGRRRCATGNTTTAYRSTRQVISRPVTSAPGARSGDWGRLHGRRPVDLRRRERRARLVEGVGRPPATAPTVHRPPPARAAAGRGRR